MRGYQDSNRLVLHQGRCNTLEDEQIEQGQSANDKVFRPNTPFLSLYNEKCSQRDGTEESRRTLS
jgi:hypothetical protein